jgi:ABC-type branched-subunit amino acid transport system substrate-binding protein
VPVDETGVTDTEIKFTSISTITGNPLGFDLGEIYNGGIEAYFAWRNDEGGIYGRQLVLANKRDDQLARNAEEAQAMIDEDDSLGAFVATLLFTGADTLNDAGVPTFGWNIHPEFGGHRALFGQIAPLCLGCVGRGVPYIAREVGATTVGILAYNSTENSKRCADGIRRSIERYSADVGGLTVGYFDNNLTFGLPIGIGTQVSEMKTNGVDFISTCMDLNGMKTLGEELARQGMDDVVMYHPQSYNAAFVAANAELFEGDVVNIGAGFVSFEAGAGLEMQQKFFEYTDQLGVAPEELAMVGWMNADLAFQGLLAAGPEFSRAGLIDAIRTELTHYTAGGLTVPINWSTQTELPTEDSDEAPLDCFNVVQIVDGKFEATFAEPGKPWICWDNTDDAWAEPEFMSFE